MPVSSANHIHFLQIAEAVNLELVNLNKHSTNGKNGNGLPAKKDTQVEIGDPYDEYFVPVNEHRKYMRYVYYIVGLSIFSGHRFLDLYGL